MRPSLRYLILAVLTGGILLATPPLPASAGVDFAVMGSVKRAMVDGRFDDAIALLEKTIATAGDLNEGVLADLWSALADAYAKAERHDKAAEAWRKVIALRIAAGGADHPSLAGLYAAFADELERAGDPKAALDAANQALALDEKYLGTGNEAVRADLERLRDLANAAGNRVAVIKYRNRLRDFDTLLPLSSNESSNRGGTDPVPVTADYGEVDETQFARVRIYYGTDRAPTGILRPNDYYGGTRGELQFGTVEVSIPRVHKPGALEAPTVASFEVSENPERHIVLLELAPLDRSTVFARMRAQLAEQNADEAFVFVHGYNVSFADAARRTAQIAYDINFAGLPILYSWPSRASTLDYMTDTAVVRHSGRHLAEFLDDIVARSGARKIHLIAHSMGNRALTDALELFSLRRGIDKPPAFQQVIFTAPDVDAGLFAEMMKTIRPVARRLTLYASSADVALSVSRELHGDQPRAGQAGDEILVAETLDTIDMSPLGDDMLGHSYFANDASALTDILSLFWTDLPPERRCGMARTSEASHWTYQPQKCDGPILLSALTLLRTEGDAATSVVGEKIKAAIERGNPKAVAEWNSINEEIGRILAP